MWGKSGCTVGQTGGFEKRIQPVSPGVFVCEVALTHAAFGEG